MFCFKFLSFQLFFFSLSYLLLPYLQYLTFASQTLIVFFTLSLSLFSSSLIVFVSCLGIFHMPKQTHTKKVKNNNNEQLHLLHKNKKKKTENKTKRRNNQQIEESNLQLKLIEGDWVSWVFESQQQQAFFSRELEGKCCFAFNN